jgi:tRNA(fMet)-specific endonuclease VapC
LNSVPIASTVALAVLRFGARHATAAIRAALTKRGTPIGPYDIMIAGTAVRHGLLMVTSNGSEFRRIDGLLLEDWRE